MFAEYYFCELKSAKVGISSRSSQLRLPRPLWSKQVGILSQRVLNFYILERTRVHRRNDRVNSSFFLILFGEKSSSHEHILLVLSIVACNVRRALFLLIQVGLSGHLIKVVAFPTSSTAVVPASGNLESACSTFFYP